MRKLAMLLAAPMALISFSALAQTAQSEIEIVGLQAHPSDVDIGKSKIWARPNVDPYSGDIDGAAFLGRVTDIRPLELRESWQMRIRGECHRFQFGSKDVFRTTFGRDKTMLANPAFTGWADVCLVRADGTAVVYPDGCKNIGPALAIVNRRLIPEKRVERPRPRGRGATMTMTQGANQQVGSSNVGVGVLLLDGGGHNTTVKNGSVSTSVSGSTSTSTSGSFKGSNTNHAGTVGNGGHHGQ